MIVAVAIKRGGKVYSLPKPNRHHDVLHLMFEQKVERSAESADEQGFLDEKGVFYQRVPALREATRCKQLLPRATCHGGRLYSEDVW